MTLTQVSTPEHYDTHSAEPPSHLFERPPELSAIPADVRGDTELATAWLEYRGKLEARYREYHDIVCRRWADHVVSNNKRENRERELSRPPSYWPWYVYPAIMVILFAFEVPFNQQAFEFVLLSTQNISWIVATIIGFILLGLSHFMGLSIKHFGYNVSHFQRNNIGGNIGIPVAFNLLSILFFASCAALTVYIVSVFRQGYLRLISGENTEAADAGAVLQETLRNLALGPDGWMMFMINAGIVIGAVGICVLSHDAHPYYAREDLRAKQSRNHFFSIIRQYNQEVGRETVKYQNQIADIRNKRANGGLA